MSRVSTALFLAVWLAAPAFAADPPGTDKKPQAAQMQEDVEVMRRILNRSLSLPRHGVRSVWAPNNGWNNNTLGQPWNPNVGVHGNQGGGGVIGNGYGTIANPYGTISTLGGWGG